MASLSSLEMLKNLKIYLFFGKKSKIYKGALEVPNLRSFKKPYLPKVFGHNKQKGSLFSNDLSLLKIHWNLGKNKEVAIAAILNRHQSIGSSKEIRLYFAVRLILEFQNVCRQFVKFMVNRRRTKYYIFFLWWRHFQIQIRFNSNSTIFCDFLTLISFSQ